MNKTDIETCDYTWNPVTGCRFGCPYCYAAKSAQRFGGHTDTGALNDIHMDGIHDLECPMISHEPKPRKSPYPYFFEPTFHRYRLQEPVQKKKGCNIFVCSMGDLFGDWVPEEWIAAVFAAAQQAPQHNYMFLTKNPKRYEKLQANYRLPALSNFWYGNSVTTQESLYIPAIEGNHYLSVEPLHSPLVLHKGWGCNLCEVDPPEYFGPARNKCLGHRGTGSNNYHLCRGRRPDWVIVGAETGNRKEKALPQAEWVQDLAEECREYKVPVFMKNSLQHIVGRQRMKQQRPDGLERSR